MTVWSGGNGARILIADGNRHLCVAVRDSLAEQGHPGAVLCHSADALIEAVDGALLDLLVLDDQLPGADLGAVVGRIRCQGLGKNPFVGIIATVGTGMAGAAKSAFNAGVDELMHKPLTVDHLFKRVSNVAQRRRPYIISSDYIGPTRRGVERTEGQRALIRDVPNSLKSCIVDGLSRAEIEKQITREVERLDDDRFETAVREVDRLVLSIAASYEKEIGEDDWKRLLERLIVVADSLSVWYAGPSKQVVADLAGMLIALAKRILTTSLRQRVVEVDLLVELNQAVPASLDVNNRDVRAFREIAKMIAKFTGT